MTVVCWLSLHFLFFPFFFGVFCLCACVCLCIYVYMCKRIWQFHVCRPMITSSIRNQILNMRIKLINEITVKYIRNHVYEYTEWMFASNLSHRDRKPKYISKFWTKHGGDGKRWPLILFPFLAPWLSRPPAIETPLRPVPAGPLISWPKRGRRECKHKRKERYNK